MWDATDTDAKTVEVSGTVRRGPVSAANPRMTATAVVTSVQLGGRHNTLDERSYTYPLVARPTKATS